jgi:hypothetical protein
MPRTKNFPDNSEFEATVTFTGEARGSHIRSVTPTPDIVTVRMHHSFIRLPDNEYTPRPHDARSGFGSTSFYDYATPIEKPLEKRFLNRHRLEKKNPSAKISEAIEPIIYYLDPGCPEPIKSALMEGAGWWSQAFEAAGYKDAFQVKVLPPDADPMDVRYNLIQWVHRSTRGWSYGSSVSDPRTGEIIKGHVSLGSLRVRQDYLIAQGLASLFKEGQESPDPMIQMALARLRQLSAHEVGHTLGLSHNFASSVNGRASVMDYPHPYLSFHDDGKINFSEAYDTGIGAWDKRTILYGYQDFPEGADEESGLKKIMEETLAMDFKYISDQDARPSGGVHPYAHLWDNGKNPVSELKRLSDVRAKALAGFGAGTIPEGTAYAELEGVLVPLYLAHRYQVEAVSKLIGGMDYSYAMRGDGQLITKPVDPEWQQKAVKSLLSTLDPEFLALSEKIISLIPPQPAGYSRHRELFLTYTGIIFDPLGAAESSINHTLNFLMHPQRLARLVTQHAFDTKQPGPAGLLDQVFKSIRENRSATGLEGEISRLIEKRALTRLLGLASSREIYPQVSAAALSMIDELKVNFQSRMIRSEDQEDIAHYRYLEQKIEEFFIDPSQFVLPAEKEMPPGSPIGCSAH